MLRFKTLDDLPAQHRASAAAQLAGDAPPPITGYQPRQNSTSPRDVEAGTGAAATAAAPAPKPRKYRNEPTIVDGIRFDSKHEAKRYQTLLSLVRAGQITDLECQPVFALLAQGGEYVGDYVADFRYFRDGMLIVEDAKSPATASAPLYRWKRKHFEAQYELTVTEVFRTRAKAR